MIELAVGFLGTYIARKAEKLVERAGVDVDAAFDNKLGDLYEWVKTKITGRPSAERSLRILEKDPQDADTQSLLQSELVTALSDDPSAQARLASLVDELKQLRPTGVTVRGLATSEEVAAGGQQVGAQAEGPLPEGSTVQGE